MKIRAAEFITSSSDVSQCPKGRIPEYAFVGRSNVGKSSLINMLVGWKSLAKISGVPGKTRLINHFKINNDWYLVDLPGYGYARASKIIRKKLQSLIISYFKKREQLVNTFVLIDLRHTPQSIDLDFMSWLGEGSYPFSIIFTKSDKVTQKHISSQIEVYKKAMLETNWEGMPPYFISSSPKGIGREEILSYIQSINKKMFR